MADPKIDPRTHTTDFIHTSDGREASFLGNPVLDSLVHAVVALGTELWVVKRRAKIVESLLAAKRPVTPETIEILCSDRGTGARLGRRTHRDDQGHLRYLRDRRSGGAHHPIELVGGDHVQSTQSDRNLLCAGGGHGFRRAEGDGVHLAAAAERSRSSAVKSDACAVCRRSIWKASTSSSPA